jgi:uncharacterized protein YxeA
MMKKALLIIIGLLLILSICLQIVYQMDNRGKMNQIEKKLEHRAHLDTMYWNHLEVCAFEKIK